MIQDLQLGRPAADCRVVVAMSGGVDSACAAALLVEAGCEVIGVTLQLYDHGAALGKKGACCAGQDIHDARRVPNAWRSRLLAGPGPAEDYRVECLNGPTRKPALE